jgi:membrane fusion protein, multidrug efflux system
LLIALVAVALAGFATLAVARQRMRARIEESPSVVAATDVVAVPAVIAADDEEKYLGVVVAREAVDIAPKVEGAVKEVTVNVGDHVNEGDKVAELDDQALKRELALVQAGLSGAFAGQAKASIELLDAKERNARRKGVTLDLSQEERASAAFKEQLGGANLSAARAQVAEQQARMALLGETIKNSSLRAPFSGTVAARYRGQGEIAGPRAPILRIIQSGDLLMRFAIPVVRSTELKLPMPVQIEIETLTAPVRGQVVRIAPEVDPSSQMIFVEASIATPSSLHGQIQAGLVGRVSWKRGEGSLRAP